MNATPFLRGGLPAIVAVATLLIGCAASVYAQDEELPIVPIIMSEPETIVSGPLPENPSIVPTASEPNVPLAEPYPLDNPPPVAVPDPYPGITEVCTLTQTGPGQFSEVCQPYTPAAPTGPSHVLVNPTYVERGPGGPVAPYDCAAQSPYPCAPSP